MASKQNAEFLARLQSRQSQSNGGASPSPSRYSTSARPAVRAGGANNAVLPPPRAGGLPPLPGGARPTPGPGFLASSLSGRNILPLQNKVPPPSMKRGGRGVGGGGGGGGRSSNRVYPDNGETIAGGNVGGFQGSGNGCRPSAAGRGRH